MNVWQERRIFLFRNINLITASYHSNIEDTDQQWTNKSFFQQYTWKVKKRLWKPTITQEYYFFYTPQDADSSLPSGHATNHYFSELPNSLSWKFEVSFDLNVTFYNVKCNHYLIGKSKENDTPEDENMTHSLFISWAGTWFTGINGTAIALLQLRNGQSNTPVNRTKQTF